VNSRPHNSQPSEQESVDIIGDDGIDEAGSIHGGELGLGLPKSLSEGMGVSDVTAETRAGAPRTVECLKPKASIRYSAPFFIQ
jgi:hypothetical protein